MDKMILSGEKYPPYKGTYYRPHDGRRRVELIFDHILKDLDQNEHVYGLRASELHDFILLAEAHGFTVHIV